jgi:hypothetical protein
MGFFVPKDHMNGRKPSPQELAGFKDLLLANSIQIDTVPQLQIQAPNG